MDGHPVGSLCVVDGGDSLNQGAVVEVISRPVVANLINGFTGKTRVLVWAQQIKPRSFWLDSRSSPHLDFAEEPRNLRPLSDPDAEVKPAERELTV